MDTKAEAYQMAKRAAGYHAAEMIEDGMVVGIGTGSTVYFTIERLAERVKDGLTIMGIPTSFQTALRARGSGIPLTTLDDNPVIDIAVDGADEVDPGSSRGGVRRTCGRSAWLQPQNTLS